MTLQKILKSSLLLTFIFSHCNGKTAEEWKGRIIYQVISLINLFIPQETVPQHHPVTVSGDCFHCSVFFFMRD